MVVAFFLFSLHFVTMLCCIPVKVIIETGEWAEEIAWEIYPPRELFSDFGMYQDFSIYKHEYCFATNTTLTFVAYDSYGDGWNGASISHTINLFLGSYTIFVNETRVLGPSTIIGDIFVEHFTIRDYSSNPGPLSLHKSYCKSDNEHGQCLPEFYSITKRDYVEINRTSKLCTQKLLYCRGWFDINNVYSLLFAGYLDYELEGWQKLFEKTGGWNWKVCNSQDAYLNPCSCERVNCTIIDGSLHIVSLKLQDIGMFGMIPAEISQLSHLQILDFSVNQLSGTIPIELCALEDIKEINLSLNTIHGIIPPEIENFIQLEYISLSANHLNGTIPFQFSKLKQLKVLSIDQNQLESTIPLELYQLKNLEKLCLYSNSLSGKLEPDVSLLENLRVLDISENKFVGGIPNEISMLVKLKDLSLNGNQLNGSIPSSIGMLKNLEILNLYANQLTGTIPSEIGNLANLIKLSINDNQLHGTIPLDVFQLEKLNVFSVHSNRLNGTIPIEISNLIHLQGLDLSHNTFSGTIPNELFRLNELQWLYLHENYLSGTIPFELSLLKKLQKLYLYSNLLTGTIPSQIFQISELESLDFTFNQLNGSIPVEVGNATNLRVLKLQSNHLSGSIPFSLGLLSQLLVFDASFNRLTGSLPLEWNDKYNGSFVMNLKKNMESPFFKKLRQFTVCCNQLSGKLRDFINPFLTVSSLIQLDLLNNRIYDSFDFWPERWFEFILVGDATPYSGLYSVALLDLSLNQIQSALPDHIPAALKLFFVANNKLSGSIPKSYSQLFVFLSKDNYLRGNKLPSFFQPNTKWSSLDQQGKSSVECQQYDTIDESPKTFDILPVYDGFVRCRCMPGYFDFQSNTSFSNSYAKCTPTPPGYYAPTGNHLPQPLPCPVGYFSSQNISVLCEICPINQFSLGAESSCHECLKKTTCSHGIIGLKENTWIYPLRILNQTTKESDIYDCLNNEACIVNGSSVTCAWQLGYDNTSVLCSECLGGYYSANRMTKICEECTQVDAWKVGITISFVLAIGGFLVYKNMKKMQSNMNDDSTHFSWFSTSYSKIRHFIENPNLKGIIRIIVGHFQILIALSNFQFCGPKLFHKTVHSSVGALIPIISSVPFDCAFDFAFSGTVLFAAILPILLIVVLFFIALVVTIKIKSSLTVLFRSIVTAFVFLFYLVHPSVIKQLLEVFHIHWQQIEGEWYLQSDMFITRSSSVYSRLFVIALLGVIVYGLIAPFLACISLRRQAQKKDDEEEKSGLNDLLFESDFGFLYQGYKLDALLYLWEILIYFRKSLLLLLGVFFGHDSFLQSYLASLVLIGALTLQVKFQPYRSDRMNRVETQSLGVLGITQMCLMLSSHYGFADSENNWSIFISIVLLLANVWFVFSASGWIVFTFSSTKDFIKIGKHETQQKFDSSLTEPFISFPVTGNRFNRQMWSNVLDRTDELIDDLFREKDTQSKAELHDLEELLDQSCLLIVELTRKLDIIVGSYIEETSKKDDMLGNAILQEECRQYDEESVYIDERQGDGLGITLLEIKKVGFRLLELWRMLKKVKQQICVVIDAGSLLDVENIEDVTQDEEQEHKTDIENTLK